MLYAELRGYLAQACSNEELLIIDRANKVLEDYNVEDYLTQFDLIIGQISSFGDTETIDAIKGTYHTLVAYLVKMQGIELSDETNTPLSILVTLCEGLFKLTDWSDKQAVGMILESDTSTEEKICELMQLITTEAAETFLPYFSSVNPDLIGLIKTYIQEVGVGFEEVVMGFITDYKRFRNHTKTKSLWSDRCMLSASILGMPYTLLLKHFCQEKSVLISTVAEQAVPESWRMLAEELVGIACISDSRLNGGLQAIKDHYAELYTDVNHVQGLDAAVLQFYVELSHDQT